jgi:tRNA (mo5U34)-methyltransferase
MSAATSDSLHNREELQAGVAAYRWFHTIDLGQGVVTPGKNKTSETLKRIRLPIRLDGRSVLDIGAWDGFFSFEAERRGARRVVAVDPECWRDPPWGVRGWGTKHPFEFARRALGSSVEDRDIDLLDISPQTMGMFDVVLFLGVFYHVPEPWAYLQAAASVCSELLIVETHADLLELPRPAVAFYPGTQVDGDPSTWWGPNVSALAAMLGHAGFTRVTVYKERRAYRLARSVFRRARSNRFPFQQGRIVAHAHR